jgi:hypothetical protein
MPFEAMQHVPGNRTRIPAQTTPQGRQFRVAIVYKNFGCGPSSHVGLGISAVTTAQYLKAKGLFTDVWGVNDIAGLEAKILQARTEPPNVQPLTHVVISAPWLPAEYLQDLAIANPSIEFVVICHSNVAFLAADPNAFRLNREYMCVETGTLNFHFAGNSPRLSEWVESTYNDPTWTLPNLYYLDATAITPRPPFSGNLVRIGCFGAQRILKNILAAGAAALQIASTLKIDLEFWISGKRVEMEEGVTRSLHEMFRGLHWAKIVTNDWESWPDFRHTARHMDLGLQPSFTETFNIVTADLVAEGVASVTGHAIDWVPPYWQAQVDDVSDIAAVGLALLRNPKAPADGLAALVQHNNTGFQNWMTYLTDTTPHL